MRKYILIILCVSIFYPMFSQGSWKLKKSKNGISIYTRKPVDSDIQEFKASVNISASLSRVYSAVCNANDYDEWMDNVQLSKKIKTEGSSFYVYYQIKLPIGFRNRDIVFENKIITKTKNKIRMDVKSVPNMYPENEKFVRIKKSYGFWLLTSVGETTKVTYQFYTDPGGIFPAWLINMFIIDGPYQTLYNLREMFED